MSKAPDHDSVYRLMNEVAEQQRKALHAMTLKPSFQATSKFLEESQKAQRKALDAMTQRQPFTATLPAMLITPVLDLNKLASIPLKSQLGNTLGFYPKRDLEPLKSDIEIREPKTKILVSKLKSSIPGRQQWKQYQSICKEILYYCLVPPLLEPIEQSALHIRDLIFNIPLDLGGFWTYITNRFGLALIFECKNYEDYVRQNELVISSKYVGNRKLTEMGLMVTRKGLHENAQKTQENYGKNKERCFYALMIMT